jgi:hypothetical protein
MNLNGFLTYIAALSVATERVTEFIKRIPWLSGVLSTRREGSAEDMRVIAVNLLAVVIGMVLCHSFPQGFQSAGLADGKDASWLLCLGCGVLASGGSGFWNSVLDTLRGVKQKVGG